MGSEHRVGHLPDPPLFGLPGVHPHQQVLLGLIRRRIFHIFKIPESERGKITISEILYFLLVVGVCFIVGIFKVNIDDIIDINGAVIGFLFIYLIPAVLHIKCLYFSKGKQHLHLHNQPNEPTTTPRRRSEIEITAIAESKKENK